ncbi:MAG TPA: bifunctional demethylmenaquinone methyltransferase/2-methoxy-6-polyprenyl-1,4-benzoquinol methylase UbiE [Sedimentisphaerales bacterium]|nr:bifunctional demethylmenaquinone methyltransferase/2-methoxy-6-polyprenyl-1,4-benzoquinol methylase UbiE [Sedimentisphaerales bacterium]
MGEMFDRIAPTYDLLNHLLSLGRDWAWRRRAAELLGESGGGQIADLATGTGDMLIALLRRIPPPAGAVGLDVSERMLSLCREKLGRARLADRAELVRADACATPFAGDSFDAVTMAFGIRNTSDVGATLREILRILKAGGQTLILEFSLPENRTVRWCHLKYLRLGVPFLGAVVSGDRCAYRYLNESIEAFYRPSEFCALMESAGFVQVSATPLTWGVASIYRGVKPSG